MRVSVIGFNWSPGKTIFLNDFLDYASKRGRVVFSNYILGVISKDGYWTGLLLRVKDYQRFAKLVDEGGGEFTITEQALERNEHPVEFNFFLINGATGRGLYQHYHQSTGVPTFTQVANLLYGEYRETRILEESKKLKKPIEDVAGKFRGRLKYSYWVRPENFSTLLEQLSQIKAIEVEVETDIVAEPIFRPIREVARKERRRFVFDRKSDLDQLRKRIVRLVKNVDDESGVTVEGLDKSGDSQVIRVEDNLDRLSTLDFDEVVKGLVIKSTDLEQTILRSHMATQLHAIAKTQKIKAMLGNPQVAPAKK